MQNKIRFYSENEFNLLNSVKKTVMNIYKKNENITSHFNLKIDDLEAQLKSKAEVNENLRNEIKACTSDKQSEVEKLNSELKVKNK